jgi:hypothetical protein
MRKSLSILLVVSLVLSLFAGVAVPSASAATAGLDKAIAGYKYVNPYVGPADHSPIINTGRWSVVSVATTNRLATYTMGDYIDGTAMVDGSGVPTGNGEVALCDISGSGWQIERTNFTAGRFRLATAGVRWDGVYVIKYRSPAGEGTWNILQPVLIKYIWQLDQNAMNFCSTNYISGFVRRGDGTGASGARVTVVFPNLDYTISASVNNYGQFGMTVGPDASLQYQRGLYTVVVSDNYPTTTIPAGTYYTTGWLSTAVFTPQVPVVYGAAQQHPPTDANNVDSIVYAQLSTTTLKWKLDTFLSCTVLYEHAVGEQPFVLSLFDDAGNPVPGNTPTLAWAYNGTFASHGGYPTEISRGHYLFVGTPASGAPFVQVTATATIGGVLVSASKNLPVTAHQRVPLDGQDRL